MTELENIRDQVISCVKCDLCKTRTNSVPGKGNPNADIMFVGEAPGRTEDQRGEPFVGAAGKKLTVMLEKNGLTRNSVYITNVVKCRPPNNRIPTEKERLLCNDYLNGEINLVNPRIICIMGNTACNSILGQGEITKNRGRIIKKDGKTFFLTFHPAATIYNQELESVMEQDISTLVNELTKIKNENP